METSDALEPMENELSSKSTSNIPAPKEGEGQSASSVSSVPSTSQSSVRASVAVESVSSSSASASASASKEEGSTKTDDRLEWASQQSTETGSLDGSCRDLLNSSITSTTSTLVPGMLEEADEEEEEEDDYTPEPISVEVPSLNCSRIESWVSKTLENLQLGKTQDSTEEEEDDDDDEDEEEEVEDAASEEEDLDSSDVLETGKDDKEAQEAKKVVG